jgi:predicted ATP-dependent endonuclease of OLD family
MLCTGELNLRKDTTVIVGRNNSGKTSLTELFRGILEEGSPRFKLEDFSLGVHEQFWNAFELHQNGESEKAIRDILPAITVELSVEYGDSVGDLGSLSSFVIDLNPDCTSAQVNVLYALEDGKIQTLFSDIEPAKLSFFKAMKERIPKLFRVSLEAQDPNDPTNRVAIKELSTLRVFLQSGFINAQRALDSTTSNEKAILGKVLETLFTAAAAETAKPDDRDTADQLKKAVNGIQDGINADFNKQLMKLIPAFNLFGYPGLSDPKLRTETTLAVEQLLSNHTTVGYEGINGISLPESYNGLGPRNLIFILLKLVEFFRSFSTKQPAAGVHLIFIEEPEAHLHPQMQNVFISKLGEIAKLFADEYNDGIPWPVQFVVTTHSSHIANEASFDSMRYFLTQARAGSSGIFITNVKDLRSGLSNELYDNRVFLHKYMTLTRCDLLFADRAILIEGPTERLLLPKIVEKVDSKQTNEVKLGSQYLSVMEVGGAYAHIFFNLLDFLNLKTLIITDLDTINEGDKGKKCKVSEGTHSSNACINSCYAGEEGPKPTKDMLLGKSENDKITNNRRLAFQVPHTTGDACGRSFEDAFMLANPTIFNITGETPQDRETQAWEKAKNVDKTDFALKYAINKTEWVVPRYIEEGLKWLAQAPVQTQTSQSNEIPLAATPSQTQEGRDA